MTADSLRKHSLWRSHGVSDILAGMIDQLALSLNQFLHLSMKTQDQSDLFH